MANDLAITGVPSTVESPREPWMCTAHLRDGSGRLCRKARLPGQMVCGHHGGRAPQSMNAARRRLLEQIDPVMAQLIQTALQPSGYCPTCQRQADALKLRAQIAVVDRAFETDAAEEKQVVAS